MESKMIADAFTEFQRYLTSVFYKRMIYKRLLHLLLTSQLREILIFVITSIISNAKKIIIVCLFQLSVHVTCFLIL